MKIKKLEYDEKIKKFINKTNKINNLKFVFIET